MLRIFIVVERLIHAHISNSRVLLYRLLDGVHTQVSLGHKLWVVGEGYDEVSIDTGGGFTRASVVLLDVSLSKTQHQIDQ